MAGLVGTAPTVSAGTTSGATFTAVSDGNWSDPATWESGSLPTDGSDVSIPDGTTVTVAQQISTRVKYLDVAGTLRHVPDTDTKLRVETIQTRSGSRYEIGTSSTPVQQGVTAVVEFIDEGPIDESEWPERRNKGLIAGGEVEIVGAEKTPWTTLAEMPTAGDTSIELSSEPTNWTAGDTVVLPGMDPYSSDALDHEDERRTVTSVSGTTVALDSALEYDHVPPKSALDSYVLNLSRNVVYVSENTDELRRGHVMIMSTGSDVRYVRFDELGRTNKDEYLTNPVRNEDEVNADDPNPPARYPFHYHRTGIEAEPHYAEGLAVDGCPGWGVVNHHAHADIVDSVTYDVLGSGFVTEGGNERGSFKRNFALRSRGSGEAIDSRAAGKDGGDPPIDDFGHAGHGFWMQSPLVEIVDNVAAGHRHYSYAIWTRQLLDAPDETLAETECAEVDDSRVSFCPNLPMQYVENQEPLLEAIEKGRFSNNDDLMRETQKVPSTFVLLRRFEGNEAFGSAGGLDFSRNHFKWKHERFSDFGVIDDLTVYNVGSHVEPDGTLDGPELPRHRGAKKGGNMAIKLRYCSNVSIKNCWLIGDGTGIAIPYHDYLWTYTVEDCVIENWNWGASPGEHRICWYKNNDFIDNNVDVNHDIDGDGEIILENNTLDAIRHVLSYHKAKASELLRFHRQRGVRRNGRSIYWKEAAADHVPFKDQDDVDAVTNWEGEIENPDDTIGLTNRELQDKYGLSVGGALLPDDVVSESWVDGGPVDPKDDKNPPETVYINAANADSMGTFEVVSEPDAAHDKALWCTGSSSPKDDPASFSFDCASGTYTIEGRIWPDSWNGDSVYYRIDGGPWKEAEKMKSPIGFDWHDASPNGGDPYEWQLSEGTHTIEIACGNDGVLIDEIFITSTSEILGGFGMSPMGSTDTNEAPTASDDNVSVKEGETVTVDVLSNDSDADGSLNASTVTVVDPPSSGSTSVNSDGTIDYTHDGSDTTADSFTYTVDDDDGTTSNEATVSVDINPPDDDQAPYTDHDLSRIEAEDFDIGGEGVAYHDTDDGNNGGAYRDTDVDIQETSDDGGGYNIGWIENGEWWEYTVDVPADGVYTPIARLAGKNATTLDLAVDGSQVATVDVPNTGGWQDWTTVDAGSSVTLSAGTHTFRLTANGHKFNINWFGFEQTDTSDDDQAPYTDHDLARIEAEDFDIGGEGVAYHDTTDENKGGAYRDTAVDIQETSDDGGGYNIGWIENGEWWEYTVDVPADGVYTPRARLAGKNATTLDLAVDGSQVGTFAVPDTGGWQDWTTIDAGSSVTLSAGTHTFRLTANGGSFNVNWFGFE